MNHEPTEHEELERGWRNGTLAYLAATGLLSVMCWLGYRLVYAQFQSYDDEGYLLITVRQFLDGVPLYDGIYTQYGPAYYVWQQALHGTLGLPLTHDATRLVTLVVWLVCSLLVGLTVWMLVRRVLVTGLAIVFAFLHLTPLTFEPGHPQELCLLSVMLVVVIALWRVLGRGKVGVASAALIGALVAITALTKVNVGAFLACAMTLAIVTSVRGLLGSRWIVAGTVFTVLVIMLIPLRNHLFRPDVAAFVVVVWSGLFATLGSDRLSVSRSGLVTVGELLACAGGMLLVSIGVVSYVMSRGTSLDGLLTGLLVTPLHFPTDLFWTRVPVPISAAVISLFWVSAAVCRWRSSCSVQRWTPYVNVTVGRGVCLLSMTNWFNPLLAIGTPFASALLANPSLRPRQQAGRRILAFTALLMALQVYPMPGTQVALGTVLLIPIALVVIPEAERELQRTRSHSPALMSRLAAPILLSMAVVGILVVPPIQQSISSGIALRMPGAEKVRSFEADVAAYRWLTANLREHCDGFVTAPGFNSLHSWTGIAPVSSLNTTVWPVLLDAGQQQQIADAAAPVERLCVVWNKPQMAHLLSGPRAAASHPLVDFITREFEATAAFGEWEFFVRRGRRPTLWNQARRIEHDGLSLDFGPLGDQPLKRLEVVDIDSRKTLADTAATNDLQVVDEHGIRLLFIEGADVSRARRLLLRGSVVPSNAAHRIIVRLWGDDGRLIEPLPVITDAPARPISASIELSVQADTQ